MILKKGTILPEAIGMPSTTKWNMDEMGRATFMYILDDELLDSFTLGGHYDFACKTEGDALFLCVRSERLGEWVSAPYSPHLANEYNFQEYPEGKGKPLAILQVSNITGEIKDMDFLALGRDFSNHIERTALELSRREFDSAEHRASIQQAYRRYSTDEEMVLDAEARYSID